MSTANRDWISKWAPLLLAIGTNVAVVAYGYGKIEQRIVPVEQHLVWDTTERQISMFVTRSEYVASNLTRDRELVDIKTSLRDVNEKLDRLLERSSNLSK